jgi:hypothetical protein
MLRKALRGARDRAEPKRAPRTEKQARRMEIMNALRISPRSYDNYLKELRAAGKPLTVTNFRAIAKQRQGRESAHQFPKKKRLR